MKQKTMQINEARTLDLIFLSEKGFSNNPRDPGGPTQDGITQRTISAFEHRDVSVAELKLLPEDVRNKIYTQQYLAPIRFNDLPSGLDYATADCSVNSGPSRATKILQQTLKFAPKDVDGILGQHTLDAVSKVKDVDALIKNYCENRLSFCAKLSTWDEFGDGWTHRIESVVEPEAIAMAHSAYATPSADRATMPDSATAKADGAIKVTSTHTGQTALATIGSISGVAMVAAGQATGFLEPYGNVTLIRYALLGLAVISATGSFVKALMNAKGGSTV